jgi:hypothetical protein
MKQIKVFKGTINGETFDNVHSYNARMTELISAGVTDIEASSSTSIKMVDDELTEVATGIGADTPIANCADEDVSLFPYFDHDDPHYLDLLVTEDDVTNAEARDTAREIMENSYAHIVNNLYDNTVDYAAVSDYLDAIRNILRDIRHDANSNAQTVKTIEREIMHAEAAFAEAKLNYENTMKVLDAKRHVLCAAKPVINDFLEFYEGIEAETMAALLERRDARFLELEECECDQCVCPTCGKCKCECTCGTPEQAPKIECNVKEVRPQQMKDVDDWFGKILESCGVKVS